MNRSVTGLCFFYGTVSVLAVSLIGALTSSFSADQDKKWQATDAADSIVLIKNPQGATLGYSQKSGIKILTVNGLAFKDLNKNGTLDKYEDWRLPVAERAKDLASKLSLQQIAGLMLYSG
ncbi:MAG: hypothetical protein ACRYFB_12845, partial [Janthinobacterium lividum]